MIEKEIINELIKKLKFSNGSLVTYDSKNRVSCSFHEIYEEVNKIALNLKERGIEEGSIVAIHYKNNFNGILLDLACVLLGVKSIVVNDFQNIDYYIEENNRIFKCIIFCDKEDFFVKNKTYYNIKSIYVNDLKHQNSKPFIKPHTYRDNEVFNFKNTSGSTGKPKIIGHLKGSVNNTIYNVQQLFNHNIKDNVLLFLSIELLQQRFWVYSAIFFEFKVTVVPKESIFFMLQKEKPTVVMGIPYLYEMLMNEFKKETKISMQAKKINDFFGKNIRYLWTGSAPISLECIEFYEEMGLPLYQGYGMSETCIIAKNYPGMNQNGSVGKPFPNIQISFDINEQILVKNKIAVFNGYAFNSASNNFFIKGGFFPTGDLGYLDENGYLFVTGRIKDVIVLSSSKKIYPRFVEEKIQKQEQVKFCMIFGNNHPFLIALIEPKNEFVTNKQIAQLISVHNESSVESEKIYKYLITRDKIEGNPIFFSNQNKVKRNTVYEKYKTKLNKLYT